MFSISYKAKQFLLVIIKLLIVSAALFYIYCHLQDEKKIDWKIVSPFLTAKTIALLFLFSITNWILEILKWQNLVSYFKTITFYEATKQSLGSLTASIFTPNRIGEYGAKMLYFSKEKSKTIILLNFVSNCTQMAITCLFGVIGIANLKSDLQPEIYVSILFLVVVVFILLIFKNFEIYGFSIQKLISKINQLPKPILQKNWNISFLRYLVFSHQFYFLLVIFQCDIDYITAITTIFSMYLLASIIPSIHFMDVAIKGSVALFLFSKLGVDDWKILTVTSLMWLFNLVFPVLLGSYFVMRFKPKTAE